MKKRLLLYLLLLPVFFMSCGDEVEDFAPKKSTVTPDVISPVIVIDAPANGDSLLLIEWVTVVGVVRDNMGIATLEFHLIYPSGDSTLVQEMSFDHQIGYPPVGLYDFFISIPALRTTPTGDYTLTINATDRGSNVTFKTVDFTLHTPALSLDDFMSPFKSSSIFNGLDWFGFEGPVIELNEEWFHFVLFGVVNKDQEYWISEAEWEQFIADFGLKGGSWDKWDANGDNKMGEEEFNAAAKTLDLFKNWDSDNNGFIYEEEFAKGVFICWDLNRDNRLSREEYLDKFFNYLRR